METGFGLTRECTCARRVRWRQCIFPLHTYTKTYIGTHAHKHAKTSRASCVCHLFPCQQAPFPAIFVQGGGNNTEFSDTFHDSSDSRIGNMTLKKNHACLRRTIARNHPTTLRGCCSSARPGSFSGKLLLRVRFGAYASVVRFWLWDYFGSGV